MILNGTQKKEIQSISNDIECFVGDIRHKESLKPFFSNSKGSVLFHLAGIIHPKKLNDLYKSGVLTKDEFEKAKKKILN